MSWWQKAQDQSRQDIGSDEILHASGALGKWRRKTFPLKNAFAYVDGIAWLDAKASAAPFCEPLRIDLENLIASRRGMSPHGHSLRRGDTRVSARHCDGFQQINTARTAIGHFVSAGPIYLTQNREAPLRIAEEHDIYSRIYQIIATIKVCEF